MVNTISVEVDGQDIATLLIDLPGRSMNVITLQLIADLDAIVDRVVSDEAIKAAVITSGKEDFVAGADLMEVVSLYDDGSPVEERLEKLSRFSAVLRRLETCGKPVVGAINGTALGGGLELCLACHYRVAADNPRSLLGLPEVNVGLIPGAGGTQRLPRLIGIQKALELMTQGKQVSVEQALDLGIVDAIAPADGLMSAAKAWLRDEAQAEQPWDRKGFRIPGGGGAMHPRSVQTFIAGTALVAEKTLHNYPALPALLSCVYEGSIVPIDVALRIESKYFTRLTMDPVYRNMIRTLFINKGAADKLARRPTGVEKSRVNKLGVLGAGMMGAGIAYVSARAGIEVVLLDRSSEEAERGKDYSRQLLQKRLDRGRTTADEMQAMLGRIHATTDYRDLEGSDLVIEAVFEDVGIKAGVTGSAEAVIPETSVFASNTSTLPITQLADASSRPACFIGLHFFSPVDRMPLVEVIVGKETGDETLARALDYVRQIRKTPIVVKDSRGFFTSRVFGTYVNEGLALLKDGVAPALIENAGRQAGMPVGPLAVLDEVSLELSLSIHRQYLDGLGDDYEPPSAIDVVETMVTLDRRGTRYGRGFYDYSKAPGEASGKRLWPDLAEHWPPADEQPAVEAVIERLLYRQAVETARCYEDGVLTAPQDADIGSILGIGFPPYTGGPLSFIDTIGVARFVETCDRLAKTVGPRFEPPGLLRRMAESGERFYPAGDSRDGSGADSVDSLS